MPPPITKVSETLIKFAITASLSETFAPPSTTTYGRGGASSEPPEHVDLRLHQLASSIRQPQRNVVHRRLLAMHDAETVGDEYIAEGCVTVGQRAAGGVVLGLLPGLIANVLQHPDVAIAETLRRRTGRLPHHILASLTSVSSSSDSRRRPEPASTSG